ncbi:MAG: alpha/beta hydrolase, partial [Saprospiraceae bacterium]|nr:alpha/beta hydrolase [Saprospiraceae bacterium]
VESKEEIETRPDGIRFFRKTAVPILTLFQPENANGQAVLVLPGGGYSGTAFDHEGIDVAKFLNKHGITAIILRYRIPNDKYCSQKHLAPLRDALEGIRYIRSKSEEWKLNKNRIGVMGFSAGGHLAATTSTLFDKNMVDIPTDNISGRPDFSILIYPVIAFTEPFMHVGSRRNLLGEKPDSTLINAFSPEKQITANTPPAFLVHAADDKTVSVQNSILYYQAAISNGLKAEMHLYPEGGHGFGLKNITTTDYWPDRLIHWLSKY